MRRLAARLVFCTCAIAIASALGLGVTSASAADAVDDATRGTARKLGYSGVEAYQAGDYRTASEKLEKAYAVLRVPSLGLWSARALVKLGKLVEGSERYTQVSQLGLSSGNEAVQKKARADAESELASLTPKIPSIIVQVEGVPPAEVSVQIDGTPLAQALLGEARAVNPGAHKIEGQRGSERRIVELVLAESEQKPALLRFENAVAVTSPASVETASSALAATESSSAGLGQQRIFALIAGGVGVVGVGVGTVFGLKSKSDHDDAARYCTGGDCTDARGVTAGNAAHAAGNVSTVAMIIGGVGLAGAAALWFTAPHGNERKSAQLGVGVGSLQLRGQF